MPKKKGSRRADGLAFQRWIKDWWIETIPLCSVHNQTPNHVCVGPGKWVSQDNDVFGCIDLIVMMPAARPIFIQATIDQHIERKAADLREVHWPMSFVEVQVWVKREPTRVTVFRLKEVCGRLELVKIGEITRRKYVPC